MVNPENQDRRIPDPSEIEARAELHLCLGHAFLPPMEVETEEAMVGTLPQDLEALNDHLDFTERGNPALFADEALAASLRPGGLKRLYSRLFLAPPFPAAINAGIHLDGALMGRSVAAIEDFYLRHGLEKDKAFKDLPDHLALQLQFVGFLLSRAAEALRGGDSEAAAALVRETAAFEFHYVGAWLPQFIDRMRQAESEYGLPAPYRHLAGMTLDAVRSDLEAWTRWPGPAIAEETPHAAAG
ncbi:TorD/DmsD family molecular chaperone [Thioalkalivibrio denitrificans]|uniref:TorD/DmsD family molecular chaperone n=1 Tax=Thioalkalivibrio denitrificans TaxID=108003 RepID=UPI000987B962|nr:molecular chaperone TorD family protein [Thioalkalivibrio denitrificans]